MSDTIESMTDTRRTPPGALGLWLREGARTAFFLNPNFAALRTTPLVLAFLCIAEVLLAVLLERLYVDGPAQFYWQAVAGGWLTTVVSIWLCWVVVHSAAASTDASPGASNEAGAATLFGLMVGQSLIILACTGIVYVVSARSGLSDRAALSSWLPWGLWLWPVVWYGLAALRLLLRRAPASAPIRITVVAVMGLSLVAGMAVQPMHYWFPAPSSDAEKAAPARWRLTQEMMEAQSQVVVERLNAMQAHRPGVVDLYAITYAPYEGEDVFRRESGLVAGVMRERFDAQGRTLELLNHRETTGEVPWATPTNLQRAIQRAAALMDRDEDVLFIHLVSHGARDGQLSSSFWPLEVEQVRPEQLKQWLDAAGIRFRVISVSACYSGSWIAPLSSDNTLVMTAADAEHTSYGCGRKSELTYFGRAMYNEQLRSTLSFEQAHAAAKPIIERREREAGKEDGNSNPQIQTGSAIRAQLAKLEARLQPGPRD